MTDDLLLELKDVAIGYGRHVILSDINLRLNRGGFYGLLGANGSGKSTLIKTILGIIKPLDGNITFNPTAGRSPALGYVPQREALDPVFLLSSFEVVLMGMCAQVAAGRRFGREEKEWAMGCLRRTGIDNLAAQPFSELSGGQKQRVLIARALAAKPDFLLLDEPTAGIDAAAAQAVLELLDSLHQAGNLTILMVNHDLPAMRRHAHHVVWLHEGKIVQGPVNEMLSRERIEEILNLEFP